MQQNYIFTNAFCRLIFEHYSFSKDMHIRKINQCARLNYALIKLF